MQTLVLARETYGRIIAVDRHQPYLDELDRRAKRQWLSDRIHTINASMMALDLPDETFDLIWSEGAIYVMGFEQGLRAWKRLLKPGGAITTRLDENSALLAGCPLASQRESLLEADHAVSGELHLAGQ